MPVTMVITPRATPAWGEPLAKINLPWIFNRLVDTHRLVVVSVVVVTVAVVGHAETTNCEEKDRAHQVGQHLQFR